jgi:ABC-type nickel/cobalt efflux system permease component RcnA
MRHRAAAGIGLVLLLLAAFWPGAAVADPFNGRGPDAPEAARGGTEQASGPAAVIGRTLLTFNREANRLISHHMRAIRDGDAVLPLVVGMVLAFAYGVIHALGPGHGKLIVVSYFLSREAEIGRGLLMGLQIAVFHVISAMAVVALADFVLRRYGLIALVGGVMLIQAIRRSRRRRAGLEVEDACCGHVHGAHRSGGRTQQGALSLGVGLVPCTGAVLILLYAFANDIMFAGMLLVIAIAAGMAITMGGLGVLSVLARQTLAARVAPRDGASGRLAGAADFFGPIAITAVGILLFWSAL